MPTDERGKTVFAFAELVHNRGMHIVRTYYIRVSAGVFVALALSIGASVLIRLSVVPFTYTSIHDVPQSEVVIILGASVVDKKPSPILEERIETAIHLYHIGKVSKILVSGDNGERSYDEVSAVRTYLTNAGIPASDIFLDHAGFDTYSSMFRAREIFEVTSAIIVTQDFHLPRALYIARHVGINAYGMVADGGQSSWYSYFREIPASIKALFDLATDRSPKYLGLHYPLTGNATSTWY